MALRVTDIAPVVQPVSGIDQVTGYQLKLEGVENPIPVSADGQVPVVFTMKEMGIDYPVVLSDQPINKFFKVPNPNFEPPEFGYPGAGGMGGNLGGPSSMGGPSGAMLGMPGTGLGSSLTRGGGANASTADGEKKEGESETPLEPPFLTVPRYDFTFQFVWTEKLLTERLEQQSADWEQQKQGVTAPPANEGDLAANSRGGA